MAHDLAEALSLLLLLLLLLCFELALVGEAVTAECPSERPVQDRQRRLQEGEKRVAQAVSGV